MIPSQPRDVNIRHLSTPRFDSRKVGAYDGIRHLSIPLVHLKLIHLERTAMPAQLDVVALSSALIEIPSASQHSNADISAWLANYLSDADFEVEELSYEEDGERKVSLVARRGPGEGGLGLFSHSDTVPGVPGEWEPYTPQIVDGRLIGRGACDMKGPLAATLVAAASVPKSALRRPLYIVITADEEVGYGGAYQVCRDSKMLQAQWPTYGVVAEPTQLRPVYAHKGGLSVKVTAHGRAAHTSTDAGYSANFQLAPFLAEMAELAPVFRSDPRFRNDEFDPPTNAFNMVISDGNCPANVYAAQATATLSLRTMPNDHREEALAMIVDAAKRHNLQVDWRVREPFYVDKQATIVTAACEATGAAAPESVPFGTEAIVFSDYAEMVVLGPGNIAQAHTIGEWIDIAELQRSVDVYQRLIHQFCTA